MTKKVKYLTTTLVAICLLACLFAAVACVNPQDDSVTYTITVQTDADSPAKGVSVQICKGGVMLGEPKTTDDNGKVEFKLVPDNYEVELDDLPDGYHLKDDNITLTANKRDITVTLDKDFVYTVKLVDESGAPYYAQNVYVMICTLTTGNCLAPVPLRSNGIAELKPIEGISDYHVKVEGLPANYSVGNMDADGYYTGMNFSADVTEMTITIYNITSVTDLTPMTEAEKAAYAQTNNNYNNNNGQQFESYQVNQELGAGKVAYFSVTPKVSGEYMFYANNDVTYLTNGNEFIAGNTGNGLYSLLTCEAGKTHYFKAVNNTEQTANVKFVMTEPYSSYTSQTGKGAVVNVTVGKANTNAVVAFVPSEAGTYSVKVEGSAKAIVTVLTAQPDEIISTPYADSEYTLNPSKPFVVYTSTLAATNYVTVTAKADKYPVELKVTITKTANANNTDTVVEVTETLTQYTKPTGKELVGIPMNGTATLVYNETDHYYHLGTTDGPVVVVNITKPLEASRFEIGGILAYMEMSTQGSAKYQFVTKKTDGENILDYRSFLRGFDEYDTKPGTHGNDLVIPTEIETEVYYAKFVNEDGVYPLTEELKIFLEKFCAANSDPATKSGLIDWNVTSAAEGCEWLFPCYYYADATEADAIVGTYKFVSITEEDTTLNVGDTYNGYSGAVQSGLIDGKPTADTCTIKINKNNTLLVLTFEYDSESEAYNDGDMYDNGSWTKTDNGMYTFTCEYGTLTYSDGTFTYVDGETTIVFAR